MVDYDFLVPGSNGDNGSGGLPPTPEELRERMIRHNRTIEQRMQQAKGN